MSTKAQPQTQPPIQRPALPSSVAHETAHPPNAAEGAGGNTDAAVSAAHCVSARLQAKLGNPEGLQGELGHLFARHKRHVLLSIALILATAVAGVALLGLSGGFLTATALAGAAGLGSGFNFFSPSAGIRALTMARIGSRYFEKLISHQTTLRVARDLRVWFFAQALPLAPNQLGGRRMGELLARVMGDIGELEGLLVRAWGPLVALGTLMALCVLVAALLYAPAAALLLGLAVLVGWAVPRWAMRHAHRGEAERASLRAELRAQAFEGLEGLAELTAMQALQRWRARVQAAAAQVQAGDAARRLRLVQGQGLHALVAGVGLVAMLALGLHGHAAGAISGPHAAALVFLTVAMFEVTAGMGLAWQALQSARVAQARLHDITGQMPAVQDVAQPRAMPAAHVNAALRVVNLCFTRAPRGHSDVAHDGCHRAAAEPPAALHGTRQRLLQGINLTLAAGERIAIRGDSGSGKSTLSELLLRLWEPDSGSISWGGVDVREFRQADWHACVAWLPQGAPVFAGTLADNLRIGDPQASDAALWAVLSDVKLADWAERNGGLHTWVGENGTTMSAGQARRLALARALLRQAPLMLLDEPTEGLDVDTADAVMRDLVAALGPRSLIIITHAQLPLGVVQREYGLQGGQLHVG